MAILPMLGIGGMQLFRLESADIDEKILPRAQSIALTIALIYLGLTVACASAYMWIGMSGFDAYAHAMTTIATGGYSTSDASMGGFMDDGADIVCMIFMILGALPFGMYMLMVRRGQFGAPFRDPQVRAFLSVITMLSLLVLVGLVVSGAQDSELGLLHSLRLSAFNTISIITGTGYATADYMTWGTLAVGAFFLLHVHWWMCRINCLFDQDFPLSGRDGSDARLSVPDAATPRDYAHAVWWTAITGHDRLLRSGVFLPILRYGRCDRRYAQRNRA